MIAQYYNRTQSITKKYNTIEDILTDSKSDDVASSVTISTGNVALDKFLSGFMKQI